MKKLLILIGLCYSILGYSYCSGDSYGSGSCTQTCGSGQQCCYVPGSGNECE